MSQQSWKKYGGINNYDNVTHLNVNSITTNDISIKNAYNGDFNIDGKLIVSDSSEIKNNINVKNNLYVENDLFTKNKLYLGEQSNYFYSNSSGIAINHTNPRGILDLSGNAQTILHIESSALKTENTIAKNGLQNAVAVQVNRNNCEIIFINALQSLRRRIVYNCSTDKLLLPPNIESVIPPKRNGIQPDFSAVDYNLIIRGTRTLEKSDKIYSTPIQGKSNSKDKLSLALFSNKEEQGWYYGGGYDNKTSESIGIMGWEDDTNFYISQLHSSNSSNKTIAKTSTSVNTVNTDLSYVMNINGPTRVVHQEISFIDVNNISSVSFSKNNPLFGIAVSNGVETYQNPNYYSTTRIYITTDSGFTWKHQDISFNTRLSNNPGISQNEINLGVHAFDEGKAVLVSKAYEDLHFITTEDQGENWNFSYVDKYSFFSTTEDSKLVPYAIDLSHVILLEKDINVNILTSYINGNTSASAGEVIINKQFVSIDGIDNDIFTVDTSGNIDHFLYDDISGVIFKETLHNSNVSLNSISVSSDFIVACGENTISARSSGQTFNDIQIGDDTSLNLTHAFVYDISHAIVIDISGSIYYCKDGITSQSNWLKVDNSLGNGMNNLSTLSDMFYIFSPDDKGFFHIFSNSKIFQCFFPNLWYPEQANPVLTVDGNISSNLNTIGIFEKNVDKINIGTNSSDIFLSQYGTTHMNNSTHTLSTHENAFVKEIHLGSTNNGIYFDDIDNTHPIIKKNDLEKTYANLDNTLLINSSVRISGDFHLDGSSNIVDKVEFDFGDSGLAQSLYGTYLPQLRVNYENFDISENTIKGSGFYIYYNSPSYDGNMKSHYEYHGFMKVSNEEIDKLSFRSVGHPNVVALDLPNLISSNGNNCLLVLKEHRPVDNYNDISDNYYICSSHTSDVSIIDVSASMTNIKDFTAENIYSQNAYTTSDYRIKDNIIPLTSLNCNLDNLRPVSYTLKKNKDTHFGFIAHEVQDYFPHLVNGEKDGTITQTLNYTEIIPLLVKEIQELKLRVKELEKNI